MKIPRPFCQPGQADVLLLWMRGRRECVYILMEYEHDSFMEALQILG